MIKIYIANLGKYNEGELQGAWVDLPINEIELDEILADKVGINEEYEEYAIHDYENDFELKISEYADIYELNELAERIENFDDAEMKALEAFIEYGSSLEDAIENVENNNYQIYYGCSDMEDVAREYIEQTGLLSNVPDDIAYYFDYKAYGRNMEIEGTFIEVNGGYIQLLNW